MLNLNAMFGSCESILESRPAQRSVSSTELQLMEMEIATDLAQAEVDNARTSATMSQLDQVFNMYNHVRQFGIDRTFLSLYNSNNQLNNMLGIRFPSCESMNSVGSVNSNASKTFLVAMEDEGEGIFAKIWEFIKKIIKKIVDFFKNVWTKIKEWVGFKTKEAEKKVEEIKSADVPNTVGGKIKRYICKHPIKTTVAVTAIVLKGLYEIYKYKRTMASPDAIKRFWEEIDTNSKTLLKEGEENSEEVIVHGNQIQTEAAECLKELGENKKIGDNLDKINEMINKINTFYSTHSNFDPEVDPTGYKPVEKDIDRNYKSSIDIADSVHQNMQHAAEETSTSVNSNAKKISFLYRSKFLSKMQSVIASATKTFKDNYDRKIKEINMLYGLAKSRRDLEAIKKDHEQGAQTPNT
jgi:hypothetical protein